MRLKGLPDGLTAREAEILMIVADGNTNRQVASALVISEKTVARHLANLYLKIGVSTRTAAAARGHDARASTHLHRRVHATPGTLHIPPEAKTSPDSVGSMTADMPAH